MPAVGHGHISMSEYNCMYFACVCFFEGSVGTRVRAQQALFSDVGETFAHCVWTPLASAGCSCCGQTGTVKFKAGIQFVHIFL